MTESSVSSRHTPPRNDLSWRRPIRVALILIGGFGLIVGGWYLALAFQSPDQQQASANPPVAQPVFAEVTRGDLSETLSFHGTVTAASAFAVIVPGTATAEQRYVTAKRSPPETEFSSGEVILEINGRPLIAVESPFPFYRDMGVGDSGPDITQLQEALKEAGLLNDVDGKFGRATAGAVKKLYTSLGHDAAIRPVDASVNPPPSGSDPPAGSDSAAYVPISEFVGLPTLPMRLLTNLPVGAPVAADSPLTFGSSHLLARFEVAEEIASDVPVGAPVELLIGGAGLLGTVVAHEELALDASEGRSSTSDVMFAVTVTVDPEKFDPDQEGASITGSVKTQLVATDALLVPAIAIAYRDSTDAVLLKQRDDGSLIEVKVVEIASHRGRSAIQLVSPGSLMPGDLIRVG